MRPTDDSKNILQEISYEMSLTKSIYRRSVYSVLDFMGDLGGLLLSLRVIMTLLMLILNFDGHLVYIMSLMLEDGMSLTPGKSAGFVQSYKRYTRKPENIKLSCLKVPAFHLMNNCKCC